MYKKILLTVFLTVIATAFAQQPKVNEKGLYISNDNKPFTGIIEEFYENSVSRISIEVENGLKNGYVITHFDNGKINEIRMYKHGKKEGKWETFNEEGVKLAEAYYKDDLKDGNWKIWDENATLRYNMHYEAGKKTGKWQVWDENAVLIDEKEF